MAKDEHSEKDHFNSLFTDIDLNSIKFSPSLKAHPDHALFEVGISMLGDLKGKRVLLLGCGSGMEVWYFVEHGAEVVGMDISYNYLRIGKFGSQKHNYDKHAMFFCMSCYDMSFKDETFDGIFGHAILHHLELDKLKPELSRVLKKGGAAVFTEPLDCNPVLKFTRDYLPYPGKHRLQGEKAMTYKDIKFVASSFSKYQCKELQLFSMLVRVIPNESIFKMLSKLDQFLLNNIPFLGRFCRVIAIKLIK